MRSRCNNKNSTPYKYYGARGIKVCSRWDDFQSFYDDMIGTWISGLSIDRIDSEGNYEPGNCKWSTRSEQQKNKRGYGLSKYKHVSYRKLTNKWRARLSVKGKKVHLGYFDTEEEAHQAVLKFKKEN